MELDVIDENAIELGVGNEAVVDEASVMLGVTEMGIVVIGAAGSAPWRWALWS